MEATGSALKDESYIGFESLNWKSVRQGWNDRKYWSEMCPNLTIPDVAAVRTTEITSISDNDDDEKKPAAAANGRNHHENKGRGAAPVTSKEEKRKARLVSEGYVLVDALGDDVVVKKLVDQLAVGIAKLHEKGLTASFILLYDEVWELSRIVTEKISSGVVHSKNVFNFDCLAWYIEVGKGGFSPHRDRQPDIIRSSFHEESDEAKYVTLWVALTDATPENSCLYVIPRPFDPGYMQGDDTHSEGADPSIASVASVKSSGKQRDDDGTTSKESDPLARAISSKEAYQNIRALPRRKGESVLFTHRIMHWGSKGNPNDAGNIGPRIAISFVYSDPAFEQPYLTRQSMCPSFEQRLLLVSAQLLIYNQRFVLPKSHIRACYEICKQFGDQLDPTYRNKVMIEFVKAMKETSLLEGTTLKDPAPGSSIGSKAFDGEDEEDDEDAMMEEMLKAEEGGYGEFDDDFDALGRDGAELGGTAQEDESDDDEEEDGAFDSTSTSLFGNTKLNSAGLDKKRARR